MDFQENIALLEPNNILILMSKLKSENFVDEIYYIRGDKKREISLNKIVNNFEKVRSIRKIVNGNNTEYFIENGLDKSLKLRVNKKSITLVSKRISNII